MSANNASVPAMKIIAGSKKGLSLRCPAGQQTRPTPSRVKEALFSMLQDVLEGACVLDLFAGSGALGLEALSRGASHGVFVEKHHQTYACLQDNVQRIAPMATLWQMDALKALKLLQQQKQQFSLVFLDPPYDSGLLGICLEKLVGDGLLKEQAHIVCETPYDLQPLIANLPLLLRKSRKFGEVCFSICDYSTLEIA